MFGPARAAAGRADLPRRRARQRAPRPVPLVAALSTQMRFGYDGRRHGEAS